jgi:hypothetical protein
MTQNPSTELLANIKSRMGDLKKLYASMKKDGDDCVYRFYHQSLKVYGLQYETLQAVELFKSLLPNYELNEWFMQIVSEGTGHKFEMDHNKEWLKHTRPIVEAYFHAKYFLEMIIEQGTELTEDPQNFFPSEWASILYLYNIR